MNTISTHSGSLRSGEHVCWAIRPQHRRERVVSWAREGLEAGERLLYVEPRARRGDLFRWLDEFSIDWRGPLSQVQLVVQPPEEAHLVNGRFEPAARVAMHAAFVERSLAEGYPAVRFLGEPAEALDVVDDPEGFSDYEQGWEDLCRRYPFSALCLYDREVFGSDLATFVAVHPRGVADGQMRVRYESDRAEVTGEIDVVNTELLRAALDALGERVDELVVDLRELTFIDVAGTRQLVDHARSRKTGRLRVLNPPRHLELILEAAGWTKEAALLIERGASGP